MAELEKAARDNHMYAESVGNLTYRELSQTSQAIILHVKSKPDNKEYDHYVLFLGMENGKAKIFNPPERVKLVPFYELAPRWDGTGLIVSAEPINLAKVFAPERKRFIIFVGAVMGIIVFIRFLRKYTINWMKEIRRTWLFGFSFAQSAGLLVISLLAGMVFHFVGEAGFLAHPGVTEPVVRANIGSFIPKVSTLEIKRKSNSGAIVIDARRAADFKTGHIGGAINIPVTLCAAGRGSRLAEIAKDRTLIVYCQSKGCGYAKKVAADLMDDGFKNVSIYKGGWVDWEKHVNKRGKDEAGNQ